MIRTIIHLKKDFSLTGEKALPAVKQFNDMERMGRIPMTEKQKEMLNDEDYKLWKYDGNNVPLAFITEAKDSVDAVTIYVDSSDVKESLNSQNDNWIKKLDLLTIETADLKTLDPTIKVEICLNDRMDNKYYSIKEVEALLNYEDRLRSVTGENDAEKLQNFENTLDETTKARLKHCGLENIAESKNITVFRMEGDVKNDADWGWMINAAQANDSRLFVFDKKTFSLTEIAKSDLASDLKVEGKNGDKVIIGISNHCQLETNRNSAPYQKFGELCEFGPMKKVNTNVKY